MRFHNRPHGFYRGVDPHARTLSRIGGGCAARREKGRKELGQEEMRASPKITAKIGLAGATCAILLFSSPRWRFNGRRLALMPFPLDPPGFAMLIHVTKPLFAWGELEDVPQLRTIKEVLSSLPDQHLLDGLAAAR